MTQFIAPEAAALEYPDGQTDSGDGRHFMTPSQSLRSATGQILVVWTASCAARRLARWRCEPEVTRRGATDLSPTEAYVDGTMVSAMGGRRSRLHPGCLKVLGTEIHHGYARLQLEVREPGKLDH
jgi:hypothetical protein